MGNLKKINEVIREIDDLTLRIRLTDDEVLDLLRATRALKKVYSREEERLR